MRLAAILLTAALLCAPHTSLAADTEVSVLNPTAGIRLAGTLSAPENPKALLVLASGSGQQNRDEEVAGHTPFRTIADTLAARGYAVLRLDDRGIGGSQGDFAKALNDDFVSDISAALAYADSIFPRLPLGVLGHSEGGITAIKSAVRDPRCRFIVTLAAPAWRGDSIVMSQGRAIATALTGKYENEALQRSLLAVAAGPMPPVMARFEIVRLLSASVGPEVAALPQVSSQFLDAANSLLSPWYRDMLRYDPAADIAAVKVPWFALNGSRDMQVLPENLDTIKALNPAADTMLFKDLNHLFQPCVTGMPDEYVRISGDIAPEVLDAIAAWLDSNIIRK